MIKRIHHINFIVNDLDQAVQRYRVLFGDPVGGEEFLPQRGVKLARFKVGETWLILVQPVDDEGMSLYQAAKDANAVCQEATDELWEVFDSIGQ